MGDGTVRLERRWSYWPFGGKEDWTIAIDGTAVGSIADRETVEVSVEPGRHTLRLGTGRHRSPERSFEVPPAGLAGFRCHGPRIWPLWLAAQVKSDLWITLRPD
jgi:hypothetical protein